MGNTDESFVKVNTLDNFYQTSAFYPMPVVMVSTVSESGATNLGSYSLCFPYLIAGRHGMMLISRSTSNSAQNILRSKTCALNFIPFNKKLLKNSVMLGYPGETTEEKMKNSRFTLLPSTRDENEKKSGLSYPEIVGESIQVMECAWDDSFPAFYAKDSQECHFTLVIDKIVMKDRWKKRLLKGKGFPVMPVDFGYRNSRGFWFAKHSKPYEVLIPREKGISVDSVVYATDRFDPEVRWDREACAKLVKVPRIFLNTVIGACVETAKKEGKDRITPEFMDKMRDKRSAEKGK